jgi:hypothetical protein
LPDGSSKQARVPIRLDDFKLKRVCEFCNNGWMSNLEEPAKPILLGLILGHTTLESLEEDGRQILAKWAGKTAIIESYAVGDRSLTADEAGRTVHAIESIILNPSPAAKGE